MLASIARLTGESSLSFCQLLFRFGKELGILNGLACQGAYPLPLPQTRDVPYIPMGECRGFTARFDKHALHNSKPKRIRLS